MDRFIYFCRQCYINNEENQLSGCVNIFHAKGYIARKQRDTFDDVRAVIRVKDSMMGDSQMVALHYCYNDIAMKSMVTAQKLHFMNKHVRSHFREHYSIYHNDICFKLETFGKFIIQYYFFVSFVLSDRISILSLSDRISILLTALSD